jgi:serine protease Do
LDVQLDELSEKTEAASTEQTGGASLQGVQVQNLTPTIARNLGLPTGVSGVVVASVDPSSPAAAADLESGDLIQEVNRKPVHNTAEYERALASAHDQPILLLVSRGTAARFIVIEPK